MDFTNGGRVSLRHRESDRESDEILTASIQQKIDNVPTPESLKQYHVFLKFETPISTSTRDSRGTPGFWKAYRALPDEIRKAARAAYSKFRQNPAHRLCNSNGCAQNGCAQTSGFGLCE
jgi:hypothetical protein